MGESLACGCVRTSVTILSIRILSSEATKEPDFSTQRLRVKTNRHHMASRWIETIKGKKHLCLASADTPSPR